MTANTLGTDRTAVPEGLCGQSQYRAASQDRGLAAKSSLEAGTQADGGDTVYGTGGNSSKSLDKV